MNTMWHNVRGEGRVFKTLDVLPNEGDFVMWGDETWIVVRLIWLPQEKNIDVSIIVQPYE